MTYFGFLAVFIGIPTLLLAGAATWDAWRGRTLPARLSAWSPSAAIALHILVAVIYTTPWDNYLVASEVWSYDPALVSGLLLGWVPVEEYTFFIVQTLLVGLWIVFLARRLALPGAALIHSKAWRWTPVALLAVLWMGSLASLLLGWRAGRYLCLELAWALPPVMIQLAFGGDILRHYGRLVLGSILPMVLYLSAADALAIRSGTWSISSTQSLEIFIAGLPVEELVFFLLTTTLIVFGILLLISQEGQARLHQLLPARKRTLPASPVQVVEPVPEQENTE
jgi:lycopene cyclase domain-containing protein